MESLAKAIENISLLMDNLTKRSEGIQHEISRNFAKCYEVFKEKEEELVMLVKNESRAKLKNLGLQKENLETLLASVTSSCDFSENVLKHGNEAEVMLVKKQLVQRRNDLQTTHTDLEPVDDDVIDYEFFPDEFRRAIGCAGHVKTFLTVPSLCFATGIGLHKAKVELESMFQVTTVDRQKQCSEAGGENISVSIVPEHGEAIQSKGKIMLLVCITRGIARL